jgi:nucleotide-binding universal stress UspA family protein
MRLNEILFPTDFSSLSELAGQIARDMAKQAGARLHVLHVVPGNTNPAQPAEDLARVSRGMGHDLRVEATLLTGSAARNILAYAREKHIDLIVIGTHGRSGLSRAILGSVAETVVRLAPCPVLTVPGAVVKPVDAAAHASLAEVVPSRPCLVCGHPSEDLVCEVCRNRIRAEALDAKRESERPGRRGMPV